MSRSLTPSEAAEIKREWKHLDHHKRVIHPNRFYKLKDGEIYEETVDARK
jgi:hypothetical protein